MGNKQTSVKKANFEDVQQIVKNNNGLLINTLDLNEQTCLIKGTLDVNKEEKIALSAGPYYEPTSSFSSSVAI